MSRYKHHKPINVPVDLMTEVVDKIDGLNENDRGLKNIVLDLNDNRDKAMRMMNSRYAQLQSEGTDKILIETVDMHGAPKLVFQTLKGLAESINDVTVSEASKPPMNIVKWWLTQRDRRKFTGLTFDPRTSNERTSTGYYNMYKGLPYAPVKGNKDEKYWEMVKNIICSGNQEVFEYIQKYLAHAIQKPWELPGVSIAILGEEGTGKGTFVNGVGELFGNYYAPGIKMEDISGRFNLAAAHKILVYADEATITLDKNAIGAIKKFITEKEIRLEKKHKEVEVVNNYSRLIITSNYANMVSVGARDRRTLVLDCSDEKIGDFDYFIAVREDLEDGGYENLMYTLMNVDISGFRPNRFPERTQGLATLLASMDPVEQWVYSSLQQGYLDTPEGYHDFTNKILLQDLDTAFKTFTSVEPENKRGLLTGAWKKIGCIGSQSSGKTWLHFKPLNDMRENFQNKYTSIRFNWEPNNNLKLVKGEKK
jgi:hypothetical protein